MNKIFGYFLTVIGLGMVFFAALSMFKVFTGGQEPIMLIKTLKLNINSQFGPVATDTTALLPLINISLHAILMFFIASCGGRVANVGVNMVKVDAISEALRENPSKEIKNL